MAKKTAKNNKEKSKKQEVKEEAQSEETEKKEGGKKNGLFKDFPTYLIVLFIAVGLLAGIAYYISSKPNQPPIDIDTNSMQGKVKVTLLLDENCTICSEYNTIIDVLLEKKIDYEVEKISIHSEQGVKALATYQVKIIPTALISISEIKNAELTQAMTQSFARINGKYVIPELNLNQTKIYSREYLVSPQENDCNVMDDTIKVDILDDPFGEISIKLKPYLDAALEKFKDEENLQVRFGYLPTPGSTVPRDENRTNYLENIGYLVCASYEDKLMEMHDRVFGYYCNIDNDPKTISPEEILACPLSPHYGELLSYSELETARLELGIGANIMKNCIDLIETANNTTLQKAIDYSIRIPATAIVECKYNVAFENIDDAICLTNSELDACQDN